MAHLELRIIGVVLTCLFLNFVHYVLNVVAATDPPSDRLHGSCSLYLNEIYIPSGPGHIVVEIGKYCPPTANQAARYRQAMVGYQVLILHGIETIKLYSKTILETATLVHTCEMEPPIKKPKIEVTPVAETVTERELTPSQMEIFKKFQPIAPKTGYDEHGVKFAVAVVPSLSPQPRTTEAVLSTDTPIHRERTSADLADDTRCCGGRMRRQCPNSVVSLFSFRVPKPYSIGNSVHAVALMYYGAKELKRKQHMNALNVGDVFPNPEEIRTHLADIIVYGRVWQDDLPHYLQEIVKDSRLTNQNFVFLPSKNNQKKILPEIKKEERSISRCDNSGDPFKPSAYKYSPLTEGELNICDERSNFIFPDYSLLEHPFNFKGTNLLPQCKKLIVNVKSSLENLQDSEAYQTLSSNMKTAVLTNLNYYTVLRITKTYQEDNFPSAPKKRHYVSRIEKKLQKKGTEIIPNIITSYYAKNQAPDLEDIYRDFVTKIREEELREEEATGPVQGSDESLPPLFSCSKESFRRLLHRLGFVYGKLNTRSVVLQDPRIVQLRGKYLERIRQNDQAYDSHKVIYLDETWIDPYARKTYGWRPRQCFSMAETAKYTYQKSRVGRGPRIIVLAAGGFEGMVQDVTEVYAVSKASAENDDYHSNIHGERFATWFEKLLDKLDEKGEGKHLIVMDNAPYHSVSAFPSKSRNKPELISFLNRMKKDEKLDGIPFHENMRKWELVDAIDKLKEKLPFRRIDVMAAERGHEVVRLPPYNCDLNPIEMLWAYMKGKLRKENRDQNIKTMKQKAEIILNSVTSEMWKPYVLHVKKLEKEYWVNDGHYDQFLDRNPGIVLPEVTEDFEGETEPCEEEECEQDMSEDDFDDDDVE